MDDLMISFYLKWRNGAEDLIRQFKDCQTEEELLEIIKAPQKRCFYWRSRRDSNSRAGV